VPGAWTDVCFIDKISIPIRDSNLETLTLFIAFSSGFRISMNSVSKNRILDLSHLSHQIYPQALQTYVASFSCFSQLPLLNQYPSHIDRDCFCIYGSGIRHFYLPTVDLTHAPHQDIVFLYVQLGSPCKLQVLLLLVKSNNKKRYTFISNRSGLH